jgi:hypothetical protein
MDRECDNKHDDFIERKYVMRGVTDQIFGDAVDRLVAIREQIAFLQVQELELEELVKESGEGRYSGSQLDALVYMQKRHYTDWKSLVRFMKIPKRVVKKFTEGKDIICLKIVPKRVMGKAA